MKVSWMSAHCFPLNKMNIWFFFRVRKLCITSSKLLAMVCEYAHSYKQTVQHMGQTPTHKFADSPSHTANSTSSLLYPGAYKILLSSLHQGDSIISVGLLLAQQSNAALCNLTSTNGVKHLSNKLSIFLRRKIHEDNPQFRITN